MTTKPLTNYIDLVEYFASMAHHVSPPIQTVIIGNDEAIANYQNSQVEYPLLWVETPSVAFVGTDWGPAYRFSVPIVLLTNVSDPTNDNHNQALSDALEAMECVWNQLLESADAAVFDLILSDTNNTDPIRAYSADNAFGWRMVVQIEIPRCETIPA
jgi:hypothetical protein